MDERSWTRSRNVQLAGLGAVLVVAALLWSAATDSGGANIGAGVLELVGGLLLIVGGVRVLGEARRRRNG